MQERTGLITFKGGPMTLLGPELSAGDAAPDFTAVDGGLQPVKLSDLKGQVVIISAVPSLDTGICELQTKRFNQEASGLNAKLITISCDLPFAQKRFCSTHGIENLLVLSDYREREFTNKYGLLIKELMVTARCVLVVDKDGKIAYWQLVPEIAQEPDYAAVIEAARKLGA